MKKINKVTSIILIFILTAAVLRIDFVYPQDAAAKAKEGLCIIRNPLMFGKSHSQDVRFLKSQLLNKLSELKASDYENPRLLKTGRVVQIKDLDDGRVEISALIGYPEVKKGYPVTLFGKRAPKKPQVKNILKEFKTRDAIFDNAIAKMYKNIPTGNFIIMEGNLHGIIGLGQFKDISIIGLTKNLFEDPLALLEQLAYAAYDAGYFNESIMQDFFEKNPEAWEGLKERAWRYGDYRVNFFQLVSGCEFNLGTYQNDVVNSITDYKRLLLHYYLAAMREKFWPEQNKKFNMKLIKSKNLLRKNEDLDQEIKHRFSATPGIGCDMWTLLNSVFWSTRPDIQIALADGCPADCAHCLITPTMRKRHGKPMTPQQIKDLCRILAGIQFGCFTGGEPFLYYSNPRQLIKGFISGEFMEVIRYGSEQFGQLTINTWGISIPTSSPAEAEKFFELFPLDVAFILSADTEHKDALARFGKKLEDIIKFSRNERMKTGRIIKYNVRVDKSHSDTWEQKEFVKQIDSSGELTHLLKTKDYYIYNRHSPEGFIQLSRIKLQGNAASGFNLKTMFRYHYAAMEFFPFLESFFPGENLFFIAHDGKVFFDFHAGSFLNPTEVMCLGDINNKSLPEIMLDGMLGRVVGFDRRPYLRYLYLARFFYSLGDTEMAMECLVRATHEGGDHQKKYQELTGDSFFDIVFGDIEKFKRHVYIAGIDNFLHPDRISFLRNIIPHYTPAVWGLSDEVTTKGFGYHRSIVNDFIKNSTKIDESIDATIDTVIEIIDLKDVIAMGLSIIKTGESDLFLKTKEDGTFLFIPEHSKLDFLYIGGNDDIKFIEASARYFKDFLHCMREYWGDYSDKFFNRFKERLGSFINKETDDTKRAIAGKYLEICNSKDWVSSSSINTSDISGFFIDYLLDKLAFMESRHRYVNEYGDVKKEVYDLFQNKLAKGALEETNIQIESILNTKTISAVNELQRGNI